MAFVPGHKHDLFLSYAHAEAVWTDAFRKALCDEFQVRTGEVVTVWQDTRNLRVGQKWASEIEEGIRNAAAFLAIVSPSYLNSPWCRQERAIVLEKKLEALKVESLYRFLKIIKTPGPGNAHEELLGALQDIRFLNPANDYEFPEGSAEFTAMIRAIVRQIRELLTLMSNKGQELLAREKQTHPPDYIRWERKSSAINRRNGQNRGAVEKRAALDPKCYRSRAAVLTRD